MATSKKSTIDTPAVEIGDQLFFHSNMGMQRVCAVRKNNVTICDINDIETVISKKKAAVAIAKCKAMFAK